MRKIPNYILYILTHSFFLWVLTFIFRIIFYLFYSEIENVTPQGLKKSFLLGIRFDIKLVSLIMLPLLIVSIIANKHFFTNKFYKRISVIYLTVTPIILAIFYTIDLEYYNYLKIRLDATALRFLDDFSISTKMIYQSYPVIEGGIALFIFSFLSYKIAQKGSHFFAKKAVSISKRKNVIIASATILLYALGIYNSFTHYPLRWSQAFFSKKNTVNQFTLNPILFFFDSFSFRTDGVNLNKVKKYYPIMAKTYGLKKDTLLFKRTITFSDSIKHQPQPNIVIVMLESVGVAPLSYYKNPINTTPKIDSIIKKSANFTNFFVHKSGTAASVFASVTGLPDIDDVKTASRNPLILDQQIIFDQFNGYEKFYFLGGSANWANIRGIFQSNIEGLHIFEEGSYTVEKRADVWGIDDYELFKEAAKELAKVKEKPFIAYIQTATNHKPFTVPKQKESYTPLAENTFSKDELKKAGFDGIDRLNALRYLDFNVATFLKRTQKLGLYENTIFVFFGDHNTRMTTVPTFKKEFELGIQTQHVPFFIHAPNFIKPQTITTYAKLVDLFPTVASLAKINYTNYTLGSNALDTIKNNTHFAFLYGSTNGEPSSGLIQDNFYLSKTYVSNTKKLYKLNDTLTQNVSNKYPNIFSKMDSLSNAFYHSTKYLYYNNKKKK